MTDAWYKSDPVADSDWYKNDPAENKPISKQGVPGVEQPKAPEIPEPTSPSQQKTMHQKRMFENMALAGEVFGGTAGAIAGAPSGPIGAMAGSGLGVGYTNRMAQAIGERLGLRKEQNVQEALIDTGVNVASGAFAEGAGLAIGRGANAVGKVLFGGAGDPALLAASKRSGIPISPGQASRANSMPLLEQIYARTPGLRNFTYDKFLNKQLQQASAKFDAAVLTSIKNPKDVQTIGHGIQSAFEDLVDATFKARTKQGSADFAFLDHAMGNMRYIPLNNAKSVITKRIEDLSSPLAPPANIAKAKQLKTMLNGLNKTGGRATGKELNDLLGHYGSAASGKSSIFKNIAKDAKDRQLAGEVFGALERDLDAAVNTPGMQKTVTDALKIARDNWRKGSDAIRQLNETRLARIVNGPAKSPEQIFDALGRMDTSTLKQTVDVLNKSDPHIVNQYRTRFLRDISEDAFKTTSDKAAISKFVRTLKKHKDRFDSLVPDEKARQDITDITNILDRRIEQEVNPLQGTLISIGTLGAGSYGLWLMQNNPGKVAAIGTALLLAPKIIFNHQVRQTIRSSLQTGGKTLGRAAMQTLVQGVEEAYTDD